MQTARPMPQLKGKEKLPPSPCVLWPLLCAQLAMELSLSTPSRSLACGPSCCWREGGPLLMTMLLLCCSRDELWAPPMEPRLLMLVRLPLVGR